MRRTLALAVLVVLVACSSPPPPTATDSRAPAAVQRTYQIPGRGSTSSPPPGGGNGATPTTEPREPGGPRPTGAAIAPALTRDRSARPPARGVYRYDVTRQTTLDGEPVSYRSSVDYIRGRARRLDDGWEQDETVRAAGSTNSETITYRWAPGRILQTERAQHAAGQTIRCRFDDPLRVLELPLDVGARWQEREPGCTGDDDQTADRIAFRVLRTDTIVVDRTRVRCFVVDRIERPAGAEPGTTGSRIRSWFAPAYGLVVHQILYATSRDRTTYELTNLSPYAEEEETPGENP